jgi:exoribonuclease R
MMRHGGSNGRECLLLTLLLSYLIEINKARHGSLVLARRAKKQRKERGDSAVSVLQYCNESLWLPGRRKLFCMQYTQALWGYVALACAIIVVVVVPQSELCRQVSFNDPHPFGVINSKQGQRDKCSNKLKLDRSIVLVGEIV